MRNTKIFYFHNCPCLNLYRWLLLIRGIDRLPKDMLQQIPIYFKYTKIRVLNLEGTPPYFLLKGTNKKPQIFPTFKLFPIFLAEFYCKYEASAAKIHAECFSGALKTTKNLCRKK